MENVKREIESKLNLRCMNFNLRICFIVLKNNRPQCFEKSMSVVSLFKCLHRLWLSCWNQRV